MLFFFFEMKLSWVLVMILTSVGTLGSFHFSFSVLGVSRLMGWNAHLNERASIAFKSWQQPISLTAIWRVPVHWIVAHIYFAVFSGCFRSSNHIYSRVASFLTHAIQELERYAPVVGGLITPFISLGLSPCLFLPLKMTYLSLVLNFSKGLVYQVGLVNTAHDASCE